MNLYSINLKEPSTITHIEQGQFLKEKFQQLVLIRGSQLLQLLYQDQETKKFEIVLEVKMFSQVRQIKKYKDLGSTKHVLIITSDSGTLSVIEFYKQNQLFNYKIILNEIYCKTGNRRYSQGQYIATDKKGRAIFLGAIEKNKILFFSKRENLDGDFQISSPLEANINNQICFDLQSLDVEFENPLFVAIETNYGDEINEQSTMLTGVVEYFLMYYEVDLSLNTIIKKKQISLEKQYNKILPLKKSNKNNNAFLLISDDSVKFFNELGEVKDEIQFPQRIESKYLKVDQTIIINYEYFQHKNFEFFILQNSIGDIFKLKINDQNQIEIQYLFTYKIATNIRLLKSGVLFFANENFDHEIFLVKNLDQQVQINNKFYNALDIKDYQGLSLIQTFENLGGLIDMKYNDLIGDNVGQFYCINSGVNGGYLQILKQGQKFVVQAQTQLPVKAEQLWTLGSINSNVNDYTQYLILGYQEQLYTLQINDKISECKQNLGFEKNAKTLNVYPIIQNNIIVAYCQITQQMVRIIQGENNSKDYNFAENTLINLCCQKQRKLVLVTQTNEIIYLIQEDISYKEIHRVRIDNQPLALEIYEPDLKRTSLSYLIIGLQDTSLRIFSLENENSLMQISVQILPSIPQQIIVLEEQIYVSLQNGYLSQTYFDPTTGLLQNTNLSEIQEDEELKLFQIKNKNQQKGLILQSLSSVILQKENGIFYFKHLILDEGDKISCLDNLNSKLGDNYFIYMTESQHLKIAQLSQTETDKRKKLLEISPKKILINQENLLLYLMCSENRKLNQQNKSQQIEKLQNQINSDESQQIKTFNSNLVQLTTEETNWISKISILNPRTMEQVQEIDFQQQNNQRLVCMNFCTFKEIENQLFLGVTVVEEFQFSNNNYSKSYFNLYTIDQKNNSCNLFHQTKLDFVSHSFCSYQGKLLLAQGGYLGLYSLGQKQILKKCEFKKQFNAIKDIKVANDRIFITDVCDSVHMIKYNKKENNFVEISDTVLPCYTTAFELIDFNTIAIADKFGNLSMNRIPQNAEREFNEDFSNYQFTWEMGYLNGAAIKMIEIVRYYYINLITNIQLVNKSFKNQEVILYSDIEGKIGQLIPFEQKNELDFFTHLEMILKNQKNLFPTARNHKLFRSYYGSQKGMIDGELCKQFIKLDKNQQKQIAQNLELNLEEIIHWLQTFNLKCL